MYHSPHCADDDSTTRPLYLVTASIDKMVLKKPISVDIDLRVSGAVTWVGRSSIEIQLDVTQPPTQSAEATDSVILTATFIFVARDYKTRAAAPMNRLIPETEREKSLYEAAEARNRLRKSKIKGDEKAIENGGVNRVAALLAEGRIFCDMPALADRDSILLRETRLENSLICQPQQRNIHGRIFGGFLMHRAFELAFSTTYVDVGDFLRFKYCVLYTESERSDQPLINVEVVAHVTRPELRSSEVSNRFYYTFTVRHEAKAKNNGVRIRKVVPATEEEARRIIERIDADSLDS
ncbi:hypothetical protein SASPL_122921 [Salvia splendens]|uniref:HotDog ACOT-type domain-containing protein n=1 Tax=Salvia splendens TaxID=180675 RepID=A0A8X8XN12_SALSN|nr:hypothetical protein SASPL_122921 [Salvia splendens]